MANNTVCTRYYNTVMGIPCSHSIRSLLDNRENLELDHISDQWHLSQPEIIEFNEHNMYSHVRDPIFIQPRGRPRMFRNPNENQTDMTQQVNVRRCGRCGGVGHNSRTCNTVV